MGQTITERILSAHSGRKVYSGDLVVASVDRYFIHDGNRPTGVEVLRELGNPPVAHPDGVMFVLDHGPSSPNRTAGNVHRELRQYGREHGIRVSEPGQGVCHQILPEQGFITPGAIMVGTDSHTVTAGAFNALATGMGSTDVAIAITCGQTWFCVPETVKVEMTGQLQAGVMGKDVALWLMRHFTASGATYKAVEFGGPGLATLTIAARQSICNMMVEAGAKFAVMPYDETLAAWVHEHAPWYQGEGINPDTNAHYEQVVPLDLGTVEPLVSTPHAVDHVHAVREIAGTPVDVGVVGTCTSGRLEDLRMVDRILAKRRPAPGRRLWVTAVSSSIYRQAIAEGIIPRLIEAGAAIGVPGCSGCTGAAFFGVPGDGEVVITTANRNFKGRLGNTESFIYLASPATVAASVVTGCITDPRELLAEGTEA